MNAQQSFCSSKWIASFEHFLKIKKIFVLSGNINDTVLFTNKSGQPQLDLDICQFLLQFFCQHDYPIVSFYDESDGFSVPLNQHKVLLDKCTSEIQPVKTKMDSHDYCNLVLKQNQYPAVMVLRFFSEGSDFLLKLLKKILSNLSIFGHIHSMIVCLFDHPKNVPSWLYQNYSSIHAIDIGLPSEKERYQYLSMINDDFYESKSDHSAQQKEIYLQDFSRLTEGLMLNELNVMRYISKQHLIPFDKYHQIIKQYKFGLQSAVWQSINNKTFESAKQLLKKQIKGQDEVIHAVMDTLKRASIGLSGVPRSNQINAPRAVLFFAGPTGVGKTELARCIADVFFEDRSQLYRLDMNEYSEPSAEFRLFGSSKSNNIDDSGGTLVRQVMQYPASLIVFENIESAHPNVLDRLPKILSDGFMSGPMGNTVFFSETIIIFTSSIGSAQGKIGDKKYDFTETGFMPKYDIVKQLIRMTVEEHFKIRLKRPKLFHCLGDNIFIFDFIRGPVIPEIIERMVHDAISIVDQRTGIRVTCSDQIFETIHEIVLRKDVNGARGIANVIEHVLINPLSRYLFDYKKNIDENLYISNIKRLSNQSFELFEIVVQNDIISHDIDIEDLDE
ncbi:ATPase AAA-2 domain-containing protein [Candidatus Magnetomorum sp. HK-1]|nr:ATPase AAA-2 domain-containing protein [Candidatus Magnetomorum sp. HK-1]